MDNKKKKIFKLRNGIKVLIIPIETCLTNVSVSVLLGQNHEQHSQMEVTHYMEHLMARFTSEKYNDYKMISRELNKRGAISNASVNDYVTNFFIQGFYKDIEFFIDLLANTISNFRLEKSIINQEKNAVIQELRTYISNFTYLFDTKIWKYMYSKYDYQRDYDKHIKNITRFDTNTMYDYIKSHILLHNIIVSVTCPLNAVKKTEKLVRKYFNFPNPDKSAYITYPIYKHDNKGLKILYVHHHFKIENAMIRLIVDDAIEYLSVEHLSLLYLNEILFNFETGVFYKMLRDKLGLIYSIHMVLSIDMVHPISSSYYIQTSVNYRHLPKLINVLLHIIENIELTHEEIENGKQKFMVHTEFQKFNDLTSYNAYYTEYLLHKLPIVERSKIREKCMKIKNTDIMNCLKKFKNNILKKALIFYYSRYNMNKQIQNTIQRNAQYLCL